MPNAFTVDGVDENRGDLGESGAKMDEPVEGEDGSEVPGQTGCQSDESTTTCFSSKWEISSCRSGKSMPQQA